MGVGSVGPPSTFDTIHPIEMIIVICNKLPSFFELSKTTWHLIAFHGKQSYINNRHNRHLGFSSFQILSYSTSII